ncbi:predicted protein [Histoplasma mississippiense (nom. inval.)]|uniref:predicted protein n=1 Tax=Ajellomyces capsulatus (strain NAm1 / WU24) TaxID=2059318 RepID=UPI000157BC0B|nr:predicted protein [Histoplasma mississippiense (nom. inval.)]EDN05753.1 predicted protein [Histoplasma mississippiense (nom. inval.)]
MKDTPSISTAAIASVSTAKASTAKASTVKVSTKTHSVYRSASLRGQPYPNPAGTYMPTSATREIT